MFSSSFASVLNALVLAAVAVSAAPQLSLSLTGPQSVTSVGDLQVIATLANTGTDELKLLNDPRTVLDAFETGTFTITNAAGKSPSFIGAFVKYIPAKVLERNLKSSFTILAPGASITITHDLSKAYNFTASGKSTYKILASNKVQYVDLATNSLVTIFADAAGATHTTFISGELAVAHRSASPLGRRIVYESCGVSEQSTLVSAVTFGQSYAAEANEYLTTHASSTLRWETWFGPYTADHHATLLNHFSNIAAVDFSDVTYDCHCTAPKDPDQVIAYVYPDNFGTIHICGGFWLLQATGTDSQGGTLVHEASHWSNIASTNDYAYGHVAAVELAQVEPNEAIANADNYEYFAENYPEEP
ncbi:peptidyl-Lys metalloendopeptidase [Mycena leptocephala]|nr:peptidyl-Lys metalloendopeptidase [Mycena leptocephala]